MTQALIISICIIAVLICKILAMKKSAREIEEQFRERVEQCSNSTIRISSMDRDMRSLAMGINETMQMMLFAYHKYNEGDAEMKAAVTNIAHDIRTPLTSICGYLSLMDRLEKSPEMERYLDIVEDRALFMKKLTEELFDYSVIFSSDEVAPMEPAFINRILEDTIMNYYAALTEKGITPIVNITENKIERMVNIPHLERVFSNLISNALKYSDGDLVITLADDGTITFSNEAKGLTNVQLEKLFNRFFTVQTARNSTGLGLSIAKKYVEEMGGVIEAGYADNRLSINIDLPAHN